GERRATRTAARLVLGGVRTDRRVVGLLGFPGDDPVLDVDLPRARARAVDAVGRPHLLVVTPPLAVELLGVPAAPTVELTEVLAGCPGGREELGLAQQRLDGFAAGQ